MEELNLFPLFLSLRVALTATLLAFLIGLPVAYYLHRSQGKTADFIDTLITLPVVLPPTVLGYYLLVLLGRQSPFGSYLEDQFNITLVFTPTGAVIAALIVSIPFFIKSARDAFLSIDSSITSAAKVLGRSDLNIFFTIILLCPGEELYQE